MMVQKKLSLKFYNYLMTRLNDETMDTLIFEEIISKDFSQFCYTYNIFRFLY